MTRIQKRRAAERRNKKLKGFGMACLFGLQAIVVGSMFVAWAITV